MTREHSLHLYKTWENKSLECRALFQQNAFFFYCYSSMCQEYMGKKSVSREGTPPHNSSSLPSQALDLRSAVLQSSVKNLILVQALIVLGNTRYFLKARCYFCLMAV